MDICVSSYTSFILLVNSLRKNPCFLHITQGCVVPRTALNTICSFTYPVHKKSLWFELLIVMKVAELKTFHMWHVKKTWNFTDEVVVVLLLIIRPCPNMKRKIRKPVAWFKIQMFEQFIKCMVTEFPSTWRKKLPDNFCFFEIVWNNSRNYSIQ